MKNWKKAGIGALCVAALLAGCGTQGGKDDGNGGKDDTPMDVTLETLREVNDPCVLLAKYDAVTVNIQGTDRDGEGGATEMGTTLYNWSYNEPYETEPYKSGRYLLNDVVYATDDTRPACLLTVCLPAKEGGEDWWVNEYHVARGTYVNICCRSGCTLYADAALTQPIDDTVSIDTNGEEMTVYVVPDVPLN